MLCWSKFQGRDDQKQKKSFIGPILLGSKFHENKHFWTKKILLFLIAVCMVPKGPAYQYFYWFILPGNKKKPKIRNRKEYEAKKKETG